MMYFGPLSQESFMNQWRLFSGSSHVMFGCPVITITTTVATYCFVIFPMLPTQHCRICYVLMLVKCTNDCIFKAIFWGKSHHGGFKAVCLGQVLEIPGGIGQ